MTCTSPVPQSSQASTKAFFKRARQPDSLRAKPPREIPLLLIPQQHANNEALSRQALTQ